MVAAQLAAENLARPIFIGGKSRMEGVFRLLVKEKFTGDSSGNLSSWSLTSLGSGVFAASVVIFLIGFVAAIGSARLSYCYNLSIGNGSGVALLFAVLCFTFPSLYYPYYALFLNPLCNSTPPSLQTGGSKRNARK